MRHSYILLLTLILGLTACGQGGETGSKSTVEEQEAGVNHYGDRILAENVIKGPELLKRMEGKEKVEVTLEGEILETCSKKGCWMTMNIGTEDEMRVRFKDYGFFVPTEGQGGKRAVLKGFAEKQVTSVADLQHYAEDAGRSQEEIDAITEPEVAVGFEAEGVIIYD